MGDEGNISPSIVSPSPIRRKKRWTLKSPALQKKQGDTNKECLDSPCEGIAVQETELLHCNQPEQDAVVVGEDKPTPPISQPDASIDEAVEDKRTQVERVETC